MSHKYACATTYQSAKGLVWLISNHHSAHLPTTQTCLLCKRLKSVSGEWANGIQSSSFNRAKLKLLFHPNDSFEELQVLESFRRHVSPPEDMRTSCLIIIIMSASSFVFTFVFVFVFVLVLLHESELCTKVCGCYKESVSCCTLSETQGGPPWIVVFQKLNGNFVGRWIWRRLSIKSQVEPTLGQLGLNGASIIPIQDQSCLFLSLCAQ